MQHTTVPAGLPVPEDDGACKHLEGADLPAVKLQATNGHYLDLSTLNGLSIIFCYPRTGAPGEVVPEEWNAIPGARGCTPQACSFRDAMKDLQAAGVANVYGLSTQDTVYQQEAKERLHLPYELLSDEQLEFSKALNLPTMHWKGKDLTKRVTLAIEGASIKKVWYPVFPTHESAKQVLQWLRSC